MVPPLGIKPRTFRLQGGCNNHYAIEASVTVRFELTTPRLTAECSSQLSYATLFDNEISLFKCLTRYLNNGEIVQSYFNN